MINMKRILISVVVGVRSSCQCLSILLLGNNRRLRNITITKSKIPPKHKEMIKNQKDFCIFLLGQYRTHVFLHMTYRKEMKDPDMLYNMLKNLLAQIKVRGNCLHKTGTHTHTHTHTSTGGNKKRLTRLYPLRLILMPGPSWNQ